MSNEDRIHRGLIQIPEFFLQKDTLPGSVIYNGHLEFQPLKFFFILLWFLVNIWAYI